MKRRIEEEISRKLTRILRHEIGHYITKRGGGVRAGPKCNAGGWVDLVHILSQQYIWTSYGHADGPRYFARDENTFNVGRQRLNQLIKLGYINTMKKGRTRWQVLCHVLEYDDFSEGKIDRHFLRRCGIDMSERDVHCRDGGLLYVAPVAIRATCGHSTVKDMVPLDPNLLAYKLSREATLELVTCFHVTPFKNLTSIITSGLRPGGEVGDRMMTFFAPYMLLGIRKDKRYSSRRIFHSKEGWLSTWNRPRWSSSGPESTPVATL